jgi:hypothetical protein
MTKNSLPDEYGQLIRHLEYSLHELPAGVLFGPDAANEAQCADLMRMTYRLEELAKVRGVDLSDLIAKCRWHYERYPHYLGRQRHFGSYSNYTAKHQAPGSERSNTSLERTREG